MTKYLSICILLLVLSCSKESDNTCKPEEMLTGGAWLSEHNEAWTFKAPHDLQTSIENRFGGHLQWYWQWNDCDEIVIEFKSKHQSGCVTEYENGAILKGTIMEIRPQSLKILFERMNPAPGSDPAPELLSFKKI